MAGGEGGPPRQRRRRRDYIRPPRLRRARPKKSVSLFCDSVLVGSWSEHHLKVGPLIMTGSPG